MMVPEFLKKVFVTLDLQFRMKNRSETNTVALEIKVHIFTSVLFTAQENKFRRRKESNRASERGSQQVNEKEGKFPYKSLSRKPSFTAVLTRRGLNFRGWIQAIAIVISKKLHLTLPSSRFSFIHNRVYVIFYESNDDNLFHFCIKDSQLKADIVYNEVWKKIIVTSSITTIETKDIFYQF